MTQKTQAAVLFETAKPLRLKELTLPALKPGQVLVEVAYSGVCHTQLSEVRGRRGPDRFLPHTLGHEGSGTVIRVGKGVTKVKPGERVILSWIKGRGIDVPSSLYASDEGPINSGAISTFMRCTVTCEACLTPIPANMPLREAALLGCAVPTGCGIIINHAGVAPGQSVAVFGTGGIGMSAILGADMVGASPIIAVDIRDAKLEKARQLGATHVLNSARQDPLAGILEITANQGVDYAVEAAGKVLLMETAFRSVRNSGGLCIVAGNPEPEELIRLNPFDLIRGKRITGTWGGETDPDRDFRIYIRNYLAGRLNLEALVSRQFALENINDALDALEEGEIIRALIYMSS